MTGSSRGIGAAIARRLAQDGYEVTVNDLNSRELASSVVRDIEAAGGAVDHRMQKSFSYGARQNQGLFEGRVEMRFRACACSPLPASQGHRFGTETSHKKTGLSSMTTALLFTIRTAGTATPVPAS